MSSNKEGHDIWKCATCDKLGKSCGGPNFFHMTEKEMAIWANTRRDYLHLSIQQVVRTTNLARGTVDSFFSAEPNDPKLSTCQLIIGALTAPTWDGDPCPLMTDIDRLKLEQTICEKSAKIQQMTEQVTHLENELAQYKKVSGAHEDYLKETAKQRTEQHKEQLDRNDAEYHKSLDVANNSTKSWKRIAIVLVIFFIILFAYDFSRSDIGFIRHKNMPTEDTSTIQNSVSTYSAHYNIS